MTDIIRRYMEQGLDTDTLILKSFQYYKRNRKFGDGVHKLDPMVTELIKMYYDANKEGIHFDNMKKSFVNRYITNETSVEGIDYLSKHGKEELKGLGKMYEYIHSDDVEYMFDIFTIKDLHQKLFSQSPYPDFGGNFRRSPAYLKGAKTNVCDWTQIFRELANLDDEVKSLREMAPEVRQLGDPELLLMYLDRCVELNAKMIKIHPFPDGNGRTIRGFTNKLMEDAGLPPVYIKVEERDEYLRCMSLAMDQEDYSDLKRFYRYKVCDSIVELDINKRLRGLPKRDENGKVLIKKELPTTPENR